MTSLGILLIGSIPFFLPLRDLQIRSDAESLLEGNPNQKATLETITSLFEDQPILIVDMECSDVFSSKGIRDLRRVSNALMTLKGANNVKSLTHSYKPIRKGFSFEMVPLVPQKISEAESKALREYCLNHPLIRNVMLSPDARHATLTVDFNRRFETLSQKRALRRDLKDRLAEFEKEGLNFKSIALPLVEEEVYSTIEKDIRGFLPIGLMFLVATLWMAFGSVSLVSILLLNQIMAMGWIAGTLQWSGYPFTVFTLLLFPLWGGIHLTLLIHLATACQRMSIDGGDVVTHAVRQIAKSCGFATLTTLAGLLSLGLAAIPQVRQSGMIGAFGVAIVFIMTFGPAAAMLKLFYRAQLRKLRKSKISPKAQSLSDRFSAQDWLAHVKHYRVPYLVVSGFVILALLGIVPQLRTGIRPIEFLPIQSPTRSAAELFDRHYGGFNMFELRIDSGKTGGANQLHFLKYLEKVQSFAETRKGISEAYSYAQVLAMMNQIWEGERQGSLSLPSNPLLLQSFAFVLKTQDFPFFKTLCDADFRRASLILRSPDQASDAYLSTLNEIVEYAKSQSPEGVQVNAEKGLHTLLEANRQLVASQLQSAFTAILVIMILLLFLWQSIRWAILAMMINVFPVTMMMGIAVLFDIPLNSITVMIAAVAFGIAMDDTVHCITQCLEKMKKGLTKHDALIAALHIKAKPMIYSSLVLGGIFTLLMMSAFPPVQHFGGLSAIAFALALASVFILFPAMMIDKNHPQKHQKHESIENR